MEIKKILLGIAAFLTALAGGYGASELGAGGRWNNNERTVISAAAATTTGTTIPVTDFQFLNWTVATTATTGTVAFACSSQDTAPTFSSSASASNRWDYVDVTDLDDDTSINGATAVAFTGSTTVRQFQIENANFKWCTAILSPWISGTTTVTLLPATNQ